MKIKNLIMIFLGVFFVANASYGISVDFDPVAGTWLADPAEGDNKDCDRVHCAGYGTATFEWGDGATPSSLVFTGQAFTVDTTDPDPPVIGKLAWDNTTIFCVACVIFPPVLFTPMSLHLVPTNLDDPLVESDFPFEVRSRRNDDPVNRNDFVAILELDEFGAVLGDVNLWELLEGVASTEANEVEILATVVVEELVPSSSAFSSSLAIVQPPRPFIARFKLLRFGRILSGEGQTRVVTPSVPEPNSIVLFGAGLGILLVWSRKKGKLQNIKSL